MDRESRRTVRIFEDRATSVNLTNAELFDRWRAGDQRAADVLFQRYLVRLTALARSRLSHRLVRRIDPEDDVLSAYRSFFMAARAGRLQPDEHDDLWPLLATLTLRKLARQRRTHFAERRDAAREESGEAWADLISSEPTPEAAAVVADELTRLLADSDAQTREVVIGQFQGDDAATIAERLNCSERTIRRLAADFRQRLERRGRNDTPLPIERLDIDHLELGDRARSGICEEHGSPTHTLDGLILHELVGQGAFSKVFRATDKTTSQTVAVKFLRKSLWQDARARAGLQREFAILKELQHPLMVRVYGWGVAPGGGLLLVTEWLDGETLDAWCRHEQPSIADIQSVLISVAEALTAAHSHGILHGDLKPQNILRERTGRIVLTDFGMARWFQRVDDQPPRGGTAGFLSPEQISAAFGELTERTDVYAWGGLAYALWTGRPPYAGSHLADVIAAVLSTKLPVSPALLNAAIPAASSELVLRCLSKSPSERPAGLPAVLQELSGHGC